MKKPARRVYDHYAEHKSTLWKRSTRKKKTLKLLRIFIFLIIIIALVNVSMKLPFLIRSIIKPFPNIQEYNDFSNNLNNDFRTNILLISVSEKNNLQDLALASFNSNRSSLTVIRIPPSRKFYLYGAGDDMSMAGAYFNKVYFNSELKSINLATKEFLATPLDGYYVFKEDNFEFTHDSVKDLKLRLNSLTIIPKIFGYKGWLDKNMSTGYSVTDFFKQILDLRQMDNQKLYFTDLKDSISDVDKFLQGSILDNEVANERSLVEISSEGNYRILVSRVANNLGATTINSGTDANHQETKVILGSGKLKTAKRLANFLGVEVEKGEVESGADIKIIVGQSSTNSHYGVN